MALRRREALILAGVAAAAAAAGFVAGPGFFDPGGNERDALRGASFQDLAGKPRPLADWRGKILVLNFWATWCSPCLEEIPMLSAVRELYVSNGVEIIGIAVDQVSKVMEFSDKMQIRYPLLIAGADGLELMRRAGNSAGGLPYTVFLDREGTLVRRKLGTLERQELEAAIAALLKN